MTSTPRTGWTCSSCMLDGIASTPDEAAHLAGIHDSFMHRGAPTAELMDSAVAEQH